MPHLVITGASRRLGLYLTDRFLASGWEVTAITRTASAALLALESKKLTLLEVNYRNTDAMERLVLELKNKPIDLLFHNASYFEPDADDLQQSQEQLTMMLNIHLEFPSYLNRALLPALSLSDNANIIHMSDIYVDNPSEKFSNYCASKAGLENMSKSFAKRFAPAVRVNTIQPGALKFLPEHTEEAKKQVLEKSLIQREAGFEPIYQTARYLIENIFITGTALKVDGGRALCR